MDWTTVCAAAARGASYAARADHHLIEDAVQEVCVVILSGREVRNPRLYGRFYAQNLGRRDRVKSFTSAGVEPEVTVEMMADSSSWVWEAVDEVCSPEEALVIRSRYIGRMTVAEIVASTGWLPGRVTGLLKSAIRALRGSLCGVEK